MIETYESERVILGCLSRYPDLFGGRLPNLSMDLFTGEEHQDIYQALHTANKTAPLRYDPALIVSSLHERDSAVELTHCFEIAMKSSPFDEHLAILLQAAKDRFVREKVQTAIMDGNLSAETLAQIAELAINAYSNEAAHDRQGQYSRYLDNLCKPKRAFYLRYRRLDGILGGLRSGTLTIIGARPSVGKTTFSLNLAQNLASYGRKVAFFSLEMTDEQIIERIASRGCSIDYRELQNRPTPSMKLQIGDYLANSGLTENLSIVDDITTVEAICGYIASQKPDAAFVDYAGLVGVLNRQENIRVKLGYISAELKGIAKRTGCRVILLSQLKRPEGDAIKPPSMADLKESSCLEQDADYILMLFRPHTQDMTKYKPNEAAVYVEKNRFGAIGQVQLSFDGAHQNFTEV